jgi:hypothetical protein
VFVEGRFITVGTELDWVVRGHVVRIDAVYEYDTAPPDSH